MSHRLWFAFLLGWLIKIGIMKFGGGRLLRRGRNFFIALIVVEAFFTGCSTLLKVITGGASPAF
jgi:hypothetical protein